MSLPNCILNSYINIFYTISYQKITKARVVVGSKIFHNKFGLRDISNNYCGKQRTLNKEAQNRTERPFRRKTLLWKEF